MLQNCNSEFTVFIVDDDEAILRALSRLLGACGYGVKAFSSSEAFLAESDPAIPGCVILDVLMPGLDGLRLQAALNDSGIERPVIFITGYGDIPMSVQAMKAGAVDFLTKPINDEVLLAAIAVAAEREGRTRQKRIELGHMRASLARLTARETEVLGHVIAGRLNKQIAGDLGTVEKTIKVHRGRIMQKLGVRTIVDLVRLTERAGVQPARPIERHG